MDTQYTIASVEFSLAISLNGLLAPGLPRDHLRERISVAEWLSLKEDLRDIIQSVGLPLPSLKNMYGLRGGELFCFWESSSNEALLSRTLSYLGKEDTQPKMCTNSIHNIRVYKTLCEVNVTDAPFQSYIMKPGRNETFQFGRILMPKIAGVLGKRPRTNSITSEDLDHHRKRAMPEFSQISVSTPAEQAELLSSTYLILESKKLRLERDWLADAYKTLQDGNNASKREIDFLKFENQWLHGEIGRAREAIKSATEERAASAKKDWEDVIVALEGSIRDQQNMMKSLHTDFYALGNAISGSNQHSTPLDQRVQEIISKIHLMTLRGAEREVENAQVAFSPASAGSRA